MDAIHHGKMFGDLARHLVQAGSFSFLLASLTSFRSSVRLPKTKSLNRLIEIFFAPAD
jgi:hypothetical protein